MASVAKRCRASANTRIGNRARATAALRAAALPEGGSVTSSTADPNCASASGVASVEPSEATTICSRCAG
jgi:hypothetical protein